MIEIPLGKMIQELRQLRKDNKEWDPEGQMPWTKTIVVNGSNGKRYKVEVRLDANI